MSADEKWRLFFAVPLSDELKRRAEEVQRDLAGVAGGMVKWVEPENMHITLKFIGNVRQSDVPEVVRIGREVAARGRSCQIQIVGAGAFPNPRRARVIWLGAQGDVQALAETAAELDKLLAEAGLSQPENRAFTVHVTLGRVRKGARVRDLTEYLQRYDGQQFGELSISSFHLMRSHLRPTGPVYETVEIFQLGGNRMENKE